jgi:hypothetical protein
MRYLWVSRRVPEYWNKVSHDWWFFSLPLLTYRDHEYRSKIIQFCRGEKLKLCGKKYGIFKPWKQTFIKSEKQIVEGMSLDDQFYHLFNVCVVFWKSAENCVGNFMLVWVVSADEELCCRAKQKIRTFLLNCALARAYKTGYDVSAHRKLKCAQKCWIPTKM